MSRLDPDLRQSTETKHRELARGLRTLPNLAVRSAFTVFVLYGLLTLALITVVEFGYFSANFALVVGLVFGLLQFIAGPWLMDLSLRWLYNMNWVEAGGLPEHLRVFVDRVCKDQNMKFPRFAIIEDGAPQAFTYGHHPNNARVVISRGTINLLLPGELEGVVAHEIGHARNWDMALMTIVNLVPLVLYYLYRTLGRFGGGKKDRGPWWAAAGAYVLYIVSQYIVLWFSRTREFYADRLAGRMTKDPNALSAALIKIAYGLAAQDSVLAAQAAASEANGDKKAARKEQEQREIMGTGALGALGIFDRKAAVSMVLGSANQFTTSATSALDPERVKSAMQWDMWNPWARWYELHSTHPLVARRLEYLSDQAASLGQRPLILFDRKKPESYWDEFAVDLAVLAAPVAGLIAGIGYVAWTWTSDSFQGSLFGFPLALVGLGGLLNAFYSYRRTGFDRKTVADLLSEVKVSPVRPVCATITGTIIGRGVPGLIYSEDFVIRDSTGILFLDYKQPFAIWNWVFGLLKAGGYTQKQVRVQGWFRRSPVPYMEILHMETLDGAGDQRTCYSSYANFAMYALLLVGGVLLLSL